MARPTKEESERRKITGNLPNPTDNITPMKRAEAKKLGLTRFISISKQCEKGHRGFRWTSSNVCCQCLAELKSKGRPTGGQADIISEEFNRIWDELLGGQGDQSSRSLFTAILRHPITGEVSILGPFNSVIQARGHLAKAQMNIRKALASHK
jgi:hypothetical protein